MAPLARVAPIAATARRSSTPFWGRWKEYERTFGVTLLATKPEAGLGLHQSVRNYENTIGRALVGKPPLPRAVYDTLIAEMPSRQPRHAAPLLTSACARRVLGIVPGEMRYYDIYPPLVKSDLRYPLAQGKRMTLEAVKPLGADYAAAMARGFDGRWMDAYPRPRKNPGAHMAGSAYDVHPYVLMNYAENYESVTTLAHEWGHAMHSLPDPTRRSPTSPRTTRSSSRRSPSP